MAFSAIHGNDPFLVPPSVAPAGALASDPSKRLVIKRLQLQNSYRTVDINRHNEIPNVIFECSTYKPFSGL